MAGGQVEQQVAAFRDEFKTLREEVGKMIVGSTRSSRGC